MSKPGKNKHANICRAGVYLLCLAVCVLFLVSCDQSSRHRALTTLFDGVPSLPPEEDLCQDYVDQLQTTSDAQSTSDEEPAFTGSIHEPYGEKNCAGCHLTGKSNALKKPPTELCFICHVDFIQGSHLHGPVAVGACLACHLPHQSNYSSLLVKDRNEICSKCHREERLAAGMHESLNSREMPCVECHGVHYGNNQYFLK